MITVLDMFKVGIGPSSSHTVGPMKAGKQFVDNLIKQNSLQQTTRVSVDIYGSLSLTGRGHHTDLAIILGPAGETPDQVNIDTIPIFIADKQQSQRLLLAKGAHQVMFIEQRDLIFHRDTLPLHENGLTFTAWLDDQPVAVETYYSTGGGFIVAADFGQSVQNNVDVPHPFHSAQALLAACHQTGLSLSGLV